MSKFQSHFRREQVRRAGQETLKRRFTEQAAAQQCRDGLARLLQTELSHNILRAIELLDPADRAVLSLRCFNDMRYREIAQAMETTESNARLQFFRAKSALKKQLLRQGLKGSSLVMALGFFGSLTDTAGAATTGAATVTVSAAAVKVPLTTTLTAVCGTKVACAAAAAVVVATGLLTTAGIVHTLDARRTALPARQTVASVHFIAQSPPNTPGTPSSLSKGAYEQWFYFPEGVDGPMFLRMQRWDPRMQDRLCAWLQNGQANYYWHSGQNRVYLTNHRLWSRSLTQIRVRRLPTDEPALTAFLDRMEGVEPALEVRRDKRTGMTTETIDHRFVDSVGFASRYAYNQIDAAAFENPWTNIPTVDERDAMRTRGWGYFSITGTLNGRMFAGRGRMPYFYDYSAEHSPWLVIELPDGSKIVDTADGAAVLDAAGRQRVRYAGGRFFAGLLRPWMGMHTIDCIRRDAARAGIEFATTQDSEFHRTGAADDYYADAHVRCMTTAKGNRAQIAYRVAMKEDLLKTVEIEIEGPEGEIFTLSMSFTFHQGLPEAADFETPVLEPTTRSLHPAAGPGWLIDLTRESL